MIDDQLVTKNLQMGGTTVLTVYYYFSSRTFAQNWTKLKGGVKTPHDDVILFLVPYIDASSCDLSQFQNSYSVMFNTKNFS